MSLNLNDIDVILESLKYSKMHTENYPIGENGYPSYEYKRERLNRIEEVIGKVKELKKELRA